MYMFYVDESGQREYTGPDNYFVLTALGVQVQEWKSLNNDVLSLKRTCFGDIQVELKSTWLRVPKHRQERYLTPYSINQEKLTQLTENLYDSVLNRDTVLISVVVDKSQIAAKYISPQSPSSLAYGYLFERIEMFLSRRATETYGAIVFDKITEMEMRREGYENLLARQHTKYLDKGTSFVTPIRHIVEGLLFIPSHENNLLQLVDICGYNIFRQFREHGHEWDKQQCFDTKYNYFERLEPKFDRAPNGDYAGWGIKKCP